MCPFRYQGQYEDAETGLYYNRFRYYDPSSGVYLSQDPIGLAGGNPTLYGYVKNTNSWLDEFGLDCHHIATNKNEKSGKQWTKKFAPFFEKAGLDMDGPENKVNVPGHKGPHPDAYHQHVFDKLSAATSGIDHTKDPAGYNLAVKQALKSIAKDAETPGSFVNKWLTKT
jgi:RHS repeat-associated protein